MSAYNRLKAKLKPKGSVQLILERRNAWGLIKRSSFTVRRSVLERALADATIEAPWKELLKR